MAELSELAQLAELEQLAQLEQLEQLGQLVERLAQSIPRALERSWQFDPAPAIRLLVMQPTPFCNIACDYCYLAGRNDSRLMSLDVVRATAENIVSSQLVGESLGVVWHAGEPLVAPVSFYQSAFEILRDELGSRTRLQHSIQTNGTLIDERWCDLFKQWNVRIGLSIDGPAYIHDKHRKTRKGKPTHAIVMRGVEALQRANIPFHVIAVLTGDSLDRADEILDFFASIGVTELGFNVDEQEGTNASSTIARDDDRHRTFLQRLIERTANVTNRSFIRELAVAEALIRNPLPRVRISGVEIPDNSQILPFAILSVTANGDFSTFSPELVDQVDARLGPLVFGNVRTDSIRSMLAHQRFQQVFNEILEGVEKCRANCDFFAFCGGGAPANKLAEAGSFATAETAYCRAVVKRPFEVVLERFEHTRELAKRATA